MPALDWIGKEEVIDHHRRVPYRLLQDVPEAGAGDPETGNLIVEGDNLEALKALLPRYAGRVDCIYIDPPYNTGNEGWAYNDNVNSPQIRKWLGEVVDSDKLSRHDRWLCMMYPRLVLLHKLLAEDGVILVSIDDSAVAYLRVLMADAFGEQNRVATLVWEKGKKGDPDFVSVTHDYVVVYAKNKALLRRRGTEWRRRKPGIDRVLAEYSRLRRAHHTGDGWDHDAIREDIMAWYRNLPNGDPAKALKHYNWSDDRHLYFPDNFHGPDDGRENRPRYDILHPETGKPVEKPRTGWRWSEERTRAALAESPPLVHFGPDETTIPNRKSYLRDKGGEPFPSVFYRDGRAGTMELKKIVGDTSFPFPKDHEILAGLIELVSSPDSLILDSFAGSGTTAHAVLDLNARTGSDRRFILVEMEEQIARTTTVPRVRGVIEGYDFEGTERVLLYRERINVTAFKKAASIVAEADKITEQRAGDFDGFERRVEEGEFRLYGKRNVTGKTEGLGSGFRYAKLGPHLLDEVGGLNPEVAHVDLARFVFYLATGYPMPETPRYSGGEGAAGVFLGAAEGVGVYLLGGAHGDGQPTALDGDVLTRDVLAALPPHDGPRIVYGAATAVSESRLVAAGVEFRQIPYSLPAA